MTDPWGVLSHEGGRVTLFVPEVDAVRSHDFATRDDALARGDVPEARLVTLEPGRGTAIPAPLLCAAPGPLTALRQEAPAALLPPAARLQIAGALAGDPDWEGIVILPGDDATHWVHVSAREVVSFQSAMTGRLATALGAGDSAAGEAALGDTMSRPERLAVQLNAAALTGDGAAIMGHLLGAELAAMRVYWLGQSLRIVGIDTAHDDALLQQGVTAEVTPLGEAWRAGLDALGRATGLAG